MIGCLFLSLSARLDLAAGLLKDVLPWIGRPGLEAATAELQDVGKAAAVEQRAMSVFGLERHTPSLYLRQLCQRLAPLVSTLLQVIRRCP